MTGTRAYLFTSESVSAGHPDKLADLISDTVLDRFLRDDPFAKVACECLLAGNLVVVAGEFHTDPDLFAGVKAVLPDLVRQALVEVGYDGSFPGIDPQKTKIQLQLAHQSPDIRQGVDRADGLLGAGDQGLMFGYACNETPELMPLPIMLAHRLVQRQEAVRKAGILPWLKPDAKSQVTVRYEDNQPSAVDTIVFSTQHERGVPIEMVRAAVEEEIVRAVIPEGLIGQVCRILINPTGRFVIGGPQGDTGLTGRKIIVDTYGGRCPHGGGAFSGKDPSKVDRSGAYAARYVAKNIVAAGLAKRCTIQLAYAIGVAAPVAIMVDSHGTGTVPDANIESAVGELFDLSPAGIIRDLDLRRPIYAETACYGHFGRPSPGNEPTGWVYCAISSIVKIEEDAAMGANGYGVVLGDLLAKRYRENLLPGPQQLSLSKRRFELTGYTVLTAATAATLVRGGDYLASFEAMTKRYSSRVSGTHLENRISFHHREKYAPVCATPIAWSSGSWDKVRAEVSRFSTLLGCSAALAHDCRVAVEAVFRARTGTSKEIIADLVARSFACSAEQLYADIDKPMSVSSDVSIVLPAVSAFLNSDSVEQAVNMAVTATKGNGAIAALTGALAEAFYQTMPWSAWQLCFDALDPCLEEIFDEFFIGCMCGNDSEIRLGRLVLPPAAPEAWQRWPVSISLAFTFYDHFCVSRGLINEYRRPTLREAAIKLFESETNHYVFPSYGVHAEGVVPAFEWYVSWPLQRRGTEDGILRRGKIGGAEGWDGRYESTLVRLYRFPTKYSVSSWSYIPSRGRLMLDVGGRTKAEAIKNWILIARPLKRQMRLF